MVSRTYSKRPELKSSEPTALKSTPERLAYSREHYQENKGEHARQAQAWRAEHPGAVAKLAKSWRAANPKYCSNYMKQRREGLIGPFTPADGLDWQTRNREDFLKQKRTSTNRRRREVCLEALKRYSGDVPCCYCCGEDIVLLLGLDHIHGGGTKHRQEVGNTRMYLWAKRNGWPAIFRVACHSCNLGAHLNGGVCPHQEQPDAGS